MEKSKIFNTVFNNREKLNKTENGNTTLISVKIKFVILL